MGFILANLGFTLMLLFFYRKRRSIAVSYFERGIRRPLNSLDPQTPDEAERLLTGMLLIGLLLSLVNWIYVLAAAL